VCSWWWRGLRESVAWQLDGGAAGDGAWRTVNFLVHQMCFHLQLKNSLLYALFTPVWYMILIISHLLKTTVVRKLLESVSSICFFKRWKVLKKDFFALSCWEYKYTNTSFTFKALLASIAIVICFNFKSAKREDNAIPQFLASATFKATHHPPRKTNVMLMLQNNYLFLS